MDKKKGQVRVTTENIFPIIRQWLYQDKDIFLRELVSNAADAMAKLNRLSLMGQASIGDEELAINIVYNEVEKTLEISDNGIGMTATEIEKYINQIAYSGMVDFAERFKEEGADGGAFIGHFGLGFYSAFMVADTVRIESKSYQDQPAAFWQSEDGIDYEMGPSDKTTRGTTIILYLNDEAKKQYDAPHLRAILDKYLAFMAWPIYFSVEKAEAGKEEGLEDRDDEAEVKDEAKPAPVPLNDTEPLWKKTPNSITDDEYKAFYKKVFADMQDPLFWIHLNMDYPFRLQGILYFPRTDNVYEALDGRIKIFYNQVFVADNIKEIIPDFLFLLRGTLDAPDLPLNVSRSFLQNDTYVKKLSKHIIRKVADKLVSLSKDDFARYTSYWKDISLFVKYGMMKETSFYDRAKSALVFKTTDDQFVKIDDMDKEEVYYTPGRNLLTAYVDVVRQKDKQVYVMDHEIDNQFMSFIEYQAEGKRRFVRVDAELGKAGEGQEEKRELLEKKFQQIANDEKLKLKFVSLGKDGLPAMLEESEQSRRMAEMQKQMERVGQGDLPPDMFARERTLVINEDSDLVASMSREAIQASNKEEDTGFHVAKYIYDLARLGQNDLHGEQLLDFMKQSTELVTDYAQTKFDTGGEI